LNEIQIEDYSDVPDNIKISVLNGAVRVWNTKYPGEVLEFRVTEPVASKETRMIQAEIHKAYGWDVLAATLRLNALPLDNKLAVALLHVPMSDISLLFVSRIQFNELLKQVSPAGPSFEGKLDGNVE
jgi:hypothetical protein